MKGSDIFYIGNGLKFSYKFDVKCKINSNLYNSNFLFLKKMKIKYIKNKILDKEKAINLLEKAILEEKLISIKVSPKLMEYDLVFNQNQNTPHYINILGINNDEYYISDGYVPTLIPKTFEGWIKKDKLLDAWNVFENEYICFEISDNNINEEIKNGIYSYRDDHLIKYFHQMIKLKEMLVKLKNSHNLKSNIIELVIDFNYKMKVYGFISAKLFILESFQEANWINKNQYMEIIKSWNTSFILLIKSGINQNIENFYEIIDKMIDLIFQEIELFNENIGGLNFVL